MREPGGSRRTGTRSRWGKRGTDATLFASTSADESLLWVKLGKTQSEQILSAVPTIADIKIRDVKVETTPGVTLHHDVRFGG